MPPVADIVDRLRFLANNHEEYSGTAKLYTEAADEIVGQRSDAKRLHGDKMDLYMSVLELINTPIIVKTVGEHPVFQKLKNLVAHNRED